MERLEFINPNQAKNAIAVKITIVGDSATGKTSIFNSLKGMFLDQEITTIGMDIHIFVVRKDGKLYKIIVNDIAGQDRFATVVKNFFHRSMCTIVVYDVTSTTSFSNVLRWKERVASICEDTEFILVGNKMDLPNREITTSQHEELAKEHFKFAHRTSAKTGQGLEAMFQQVCETGIEKALHLLQENNPEPVPFPEPEQVSIESKCRC